MSYRDDLSLRIRKIICVTFMLFSDSVKIWIYLILHVLAWVADGLGKNLLAWSSSFYKTSHLLSLRTSLGT